MMRIIVDSQSNRLFRGSKFEQVYDQRGGLCQLGCNGLIVTTDPIDLDYLEYWKGLGLEIPRMLVAGPFDPELTLSELIISKPALQEEIKNIADQNGEYSRLEFFCVEEAERRLTETLRIPAYCNFDFSIAYSRKRKAKVLFADIGVPTPRWTHCVYRGNLASIGKSYLDSGISFMVKADDSTGGVSCGGMTIVRNDEDLASIFSNSDKYGEDFMIEELIDSSCTVSVHWEIYTSLRAKFIGIFKQVSKNYSYSGAVWPSGIDGKIHSSILSDLENRVWPALVASKAVGFFCADIVLDNEGNYYWVDFNPRKGAILYVRDLVGRLRLKVFKGKWVEFAHEHIKLPSRESQSCFFGGIASKLEGMIAPSKNAGFVVVTNPGVIPYGYVDLTGISPRIGGSGAILEEVKTKLAT